MILVLLLRNSLLIENAVQALRLDLTRRRESPSLIRQEAMYGLSRYTSSASHCQDCLNLNLEDAVLQVGVNPIKRGGSDRIEVLPASATSSYEPLRMSSYEIM